MSTNQIAEFQLLMQHMQRMTEALQLMSAQTGTRITREQLAERIGVHRNTLRVHLENDTSMPRPCKDGKWLLSEVIEWEARKLQRARH